MWAEVNGERKKVAWYVSYFPFATLHFVTQPPTCRLYVSLVMSLAAMMWLSLLLWCKACITQKCQEAADRDTVWLRRDLMQTSTSP